MEEDIEPDGAGQSGDAEQGAKDGPHDGRQQNRRRWAGKIKSEKHFAACKPDVKPYKDRDGNGLYLLVLPSGGKYWHYDYKIDGKNKTLSLGVYNGSPGVSLKEARTLRDEAKRLIATGLDPQVAKKQAAIENISHAKNSFERVAREFFTKRKVAQSTMDEEMRKLEVNIFPMIGNLPMRQITPPTMLKVIRTIEGRGALEVARRCATLCSQTFRYGIACGYNEHNPIPDIKAAFKERVNGHFAAIDADGLPRFLQKLNSPATSLEPRTRIAIRFMMYTFVRTGDLRNARWCDFDLDNARWEIPARNRKLQEHEKLDKKNVFVVPLSRQSLALLEQLRPFSDCSHDGYLFVGRSKPKSQMSENTILKAIERMGYKGEMTGHGFRSLATSICFARLKWNKLIVDCQLAHVMASKTDGAYYRDMYKDERITMMQQYADFIDNVERESKA